MTVIAIVDYDVGNIRSIQNALVSQGASVIITKDKKELLSADGVILPGVGSFKHGMEKLQESKLDDILKDFINTQKPLLGICLGMQLLFSKSYEFGEAKGLNFIPGVVKKIMLNCECDSKLPHVNWNSIEPATMEWKDSIFKGIEPGAAVYFVHSYSATPASHGNVLSETKYSKHNFCSAVQHGNVYGCQFHPEKSGVVGLKIISNFIEICRVKYD
jgi:glutamine amidotransferase